MQGCQLIGSTSARDTVPSTGPLKLFSWTEMPCGSDLKLGSFWAVGFRDWSRLTASEGTETMYELMPRRRNEKRKKPEGGVGRRGEDHMPPLLASPSCKFHFDVFYGHVFA